MTTTADMSELLAELETSMHRQLECARKEDHAGVLEAGERVDKALRIAAANDRPLSEQDTERLVRIRQLHRRLGTTLAVQSQEVAAKLARFRTGKKTLHAYRDAL